MNDTDKSSDHDAPPKSEVDAADFGEAIERALTTDQWQPVVNLLAFGDADFGEQQLRERCERAYQRGFEAAVAGVLEYLKRSLEKCGRTPGTEP